MFVRRKTITGVYRQTCILQLYFFVPRTMTDLSRCWWLLKDKAGNMVKLQLSIWQNASSSSGRLRSTQTDGKTMQRSSRQLFHQERLFCKCPYSEYPRDLTNSASRPQRHCCWEKQHDSKEYPAVREALGWLFSLVSRSASNEHMLC